MSTMKSYGQFCGLTRAAQIVAERWTLLILRDLLVSPKRFNELRHGNPGLPSNLLSSRLRELEEQGISQRRLDGRSVVYELTAYGRDLEPILNALGLWGARRMDHPLDGEVPTDNSLAASLMASRTAATVKPFTVAIQAGPAKAHAHVLAAGVDAQPGELDDADLHLQGIGLRTLMATGESTDLLASGELEVRGDAGLLARFTDAFRAPLDDMATAGDPH
jgi:DNA-binding HxlR family transcriptional regulator